MLFQIILIEMGRSAFFFVVEFGIALPDGSAVLVCGVPDFGTVIFSTIAADQLSGGWAAQWVWRPLAFLLSSSSCTFSLSSGAIMAS